MAGKRPSVGGGVVRRGQFERNIELFKEQVLEYIDGELDRQHANATAIWAASLGGYHVKQVQPEIADLKRRLAWLELPWWRRLLVRARVRWHQLQHLGQEVVDVQDLAPDPEPEEEPADG